MFETLVVRILEFEVNGLTLPGRSSVDVELWDCSGDKKWVNFICRLTKKVTYPYILVHMDQSVIRFAEHSVLKERAFWEQNTSNVCVYVCVCTVCVCRNETEPFPGDHWFLVPLNCLFCQGIQTNNPKQTLSSCSACNPLITAYDHPFKDVH